MKQISKIYGADSGLKTEKSHNSLTASNIAGGGVLKAIFFVLLIKSHLVMAQNPNSLIPDYGYKDYGIAFKLNSQLFTINDTLYALITGENNPIQFIYKTIVNDEAYHFYYSFPDSGWHNIKVFNETDTANFSIYISVKSTACSEPGDNPCNFICNPGFCKDIVSYQNEEITGSSQLYKSYSWYGQDFSSAWGTQGTSSDMFSTESTNSNFLIPQNQEGFQLTMPQMNLCEELFDPITNSIYNHGTYAGFRTFAEGWDNVNIPDDTPDPREYVWQSLKATMTEGAYKFTAYVSLADRSSYASNIDVFFGTGLGYQVNNVSSLPYPLYINVVPQLSFAPTYIDANSNPLTDKTNWVKLEGIVNVPQGVTYNSIYIGNFNSNANTQLLPVSVVSPFEPHVYPQSYYFIDNISVEPYINPVAQDIFVPCGDDEFEIGPAPMDGFTYEWSPGNLPINDFDHSTTFFSNTNTTTNPEVINAVLTATNSEGCTLTYNYSITMAPQIADFEIMGADFACQEDNYTISNYNDNVLYTWTISGGTPATATGESVFIEWENGMPGTITVMATYGNCKLKVVKRIKPCCIPENYNYIANGNVQTNNASTMLAQIGNGGIISNQIIGINGIFIIDQFLSFDNCNIAFGPNAQILVNPGVTLVVTNGSHLYACDEMWMGIFENDPTSQVIIHSSMIEDAICALVSMFDSKFSVTNSVFNKNYYGVSAVFHSGNMGNPITGNKFMCGSINNIGSAYLKPPHQNERSQIGVNLMNAQTASIKIGNVGAHNANKFENQNFGIKNVNTNLIVENCSFDYSYDSNNPMFSGGVNPSPGNQFPVGNTDIFVQNSAPNASSINLRVGGYNAGEQCTFNESGIGVFVYGKVKTDIANNTINDCEYGIIVNKVPPQSSNPSPNQLTQVNMIENKINSAVFGIWCVENTGSSILIDGNILKKIHRAGIYCANTSFTGKLPSLRILNNPTITGSKMLVGILVRNYFSPRIDYNHIEFTGSFASFNTGSLRRGIVLENAVNLSSISFNTIGRSNTDPFALPPTGSDYLNLRGIDCENSPGTLILCNQTNHTGVGLQITGNNLKTRIQKNIFNYSVLGVRLHDAVMSNQGSATSPWSAYFNEWRNSYTSLSWGARIQGSIITQIPVSWTYSPMPPNFSDYVPCDYGTENPCDYYVSSSPTNGLFEVNRVDAPSFECENPLPGIYSYSDRYDPWIDGDTLFTNQDSSGLRQLFRHYALKDLSEDSVLWTLTDSLSQKYRDWANDLKLGYEGKIYDLVKAYEMGDTTLVKALHLNLPDTSLLTSLYKDLHQIYQDTWMRDSVEVDSGRVEFIFNLAMSDPNKLGDVVYDSKTILGLIGSDDESRSQVVSKGKTFQQLIHEAMVFPNPAMSQIQIQMPDNFVGDLQFFIYDISGRNRYDVKWRITDNSAKTIDIEALSSGTYFYKLVGRNFNQTGKIIKL